MKAPALLLLLSLSFSLVYCHVFPLGVHKHEAVSLKAGANVYPLQGNINQYAEFFVNVSIGTPPQILRVQVDTGSTDLVVFAKGCYKCPTADNVTYFDPAGSKTNAPIDCDDDEYDCDVNNCWDDSYCPLEIQYGSGGSITGYAARDTITLGSLSAQASFGLIQQLSGQFENLGIDGCWGFAYEGLSSWGDGAVVDHFTFDNKIYDSFSLCLTPENPVMEIGTNYQGNSLYEWTKVNAEDWFTIEMEDISVGGKSLGISKFYLNENGVIADSGTTLFIVNKRVMAGIQGALTSLCSSSVQLPGVCSLSNSSQSLFSGYCFPMTDSQISLFPNITTTLKDMSSPVVIPPQAYLWEGAGIEGTYCLGIQYIPSSDGLPLILGDIVLQNYHVVFDKEKNLLGWGPLSSCPSS